MQAGHNGNVSPLPLAKKACCQVASGIHTLPSKCCSRAHGSGKRLRCSAPPAVRRAHDAPRTAVR